jgi:hypothetical protein
LFCPVLCIRQEAEKKDLRVEVKFNVNKFSFSFGIEISNKNKDRHTYTQKKDTVQDNRVLSGLIVANGLR